MELTASTTVPQPAEAVRALILDLANRPTWAASSRSIEVPDGYRSPAELGLRYDEVIAHESIQVELEGEVCELSAERIAFRGSGEQVDFTREIECSAGPRGTLVTQRFRVEFKSLALALMQKKIAAVLESLNSADLVGLEAALNDSN